MQVQPSEEGYDNLADAEMGPERSSNILKVTQLVWKRWELDPNLNSCHYTICFRGSGCKWVEG